MDPTTTEELLRLPIDELAVLSFLSAQAGSDDAFVSRNTDLVAQLRDCSYERFFWLVRRLERRELISRRKLNHVGSEWTIFAKVPDAATTDDLFVIPQVKLAYQQVPRTRRATDVLPLVGQVPARKPPVLHFPRGESDFTWTITDTKTNEPSKDCVVRASLVYGRSQFGVGGTAVENFNNRLLEHCGEGQYACRIRIGGQAVVGTNYTTVISARRGDRPFGFWEEPSEVTDPIC